MSHEAVLEPATRAGRYAKPLFVTTIVAGSFLLFLTQPMIARMALPRLGGAPAVWNSAMLVYQALLLAGYAYAHVLGRLRPRMQAALHLGLFAVAALWLPVGLIGADPPLDVSPALWAPAFLAASIGPLFLIVAAQAPLMQRWFALDPARGEPYPLYAASNLGSFAGLLAYPLAVEPALTLAQQSLLWSGGYGLLALLVIGCALTIPPSVREESQPRLSPAPSARRVLHWMALAATPSGLMLSTTTHLTTDIVAMPLIWVVPLGIYLLSYSIAFATRRAIPQFMGQVAPLIILIAGGLAFASGTRQPLAAAGLGLSLLLFVAVALHAELYRLRPAPDRLTGFYLALAAGGALGGAFCALLAPLLFDWTYEHPLLILAAALLIPQRSYVPGIERLWSDRKLAIPIGLALAGGAIALSLIGAERWPADPPAWLPTAAIVLIALAAVVASGARPVFAACLAALMLAYGGWGVLELSKAGVRTRSYFGTYLVGTDEARNAISLTHGTTLHGVQNLAAGRRFEPTTYYARGSGVGLAMQAAPRLFGAGARIGVVGLGTGTLACYKQPGQSWRFFEIDPSMARLATQSGYFTFVKRCAPDADIVLGDARLTLADQPQAGLDLLAIDAFSSDTVPMHLLTREAFGVYARALQSRGLLVVHISNRYLDLEPVVAAAARAGGWSAMKLNYIPGDKARADNATSSEWIALARGQDVLDDMLFASGAFADWRDLEPRPGFAGWSDDFASILPLVHGVGE